MYTTTAYTRSYTPGASAAAWGSVLAAVGIFFMGTILVPLAALFTLSAVVASLVRPTFVGLLAAMTSLVLTCVALATSPVLLLIIATMLS